MATHYGDALNELAKDIYEVADSKGFWDEPFTDDNILTVPAKLALVHGEADEALEVHREAYNDGEEDPISHLTPMQEDDLTEELADIVIRVLDLAGSYDLDIGNTLVAKVEKNRGRPHKHGKRY